MEIEARYSSAGGFVQEFIRTATGWNAYWVNDRIYPRRPFVYVPNASQIDQALEKGDVLKYVQLHDLGYQQTVASALHGNLVPVV